jgi:deoxyribose-phosphate aldolase
MKSQALAARIEHTLLRPDATPTDVDTLCAEARREGFGGVCVNPVHVARCRQQLAGGSVRVVTVVGFPLGANVTATKVHEAELALEHGADELDMVMHVGLLRAGRLDEVRADIRAVTQAAATHSVKVILEVGLLLEAEIDTATQLAADAGARFIKTCTGFAAHGGGVEPWHIERIRRALGGAHPEIRIKASGGIRTWAQAQTLLDAGATRLGTSHGVAIMRQAMAR